MKRSVTNKIRKKRKWKYMKCSIKPKKATRSGRQK